MCLPEHINKCGEVPQILVRYGGAKYKDFPLCPSPPSAPPSAPPTTGRRLAALAERSGWTEPELEALVHQYAQEQRGGGGGGANDAAEASAVLSRLGPLGRTTQLPTFGAALARASSAARKEDGRLEQVRAFVRDVLGLAPPGSAAGADSNANINGAAFTKAVRELAASRAAAAEARAFRRKLQGLDEDSYACLGDATSHCLATEIISECPGSLDLMRAKTIPFSSEAGTAPLGQLYYDPSSVSRDCLNDETCYEQLQQLKPSAQAGVLGSFSLWPQMTQTEQRLSAPNVSCAFADSKGDGVCAGSLAELNALLYDAWYKANRTDIDYEPVNRWRGLDLDLEGAYEVASHFSVFSLADLNFEHTVLYNGTYYGGYPQLRQPGDTSYQEPSIGALANRVHAAISTALLRKGAQGESLLDGGFESVPLKHMGFPSKSRTFVISYEAAVDFWIVPFVLSFFLPLQVMLLVSEKSQCMREVMTMSGMRRSAFWLINWLYGYFLFLCQLVVVLIIGFGNDHRIFVFHDLGLTLFFYLLFGMAMTSFSCFFSTMFNSKAIAGIVASCFIFLVGLYGTPFPSPSPSPSPNPRKQEAPSRLPRLHTPHLA